MLVATVLQSATGQGATGGEFKELTDRQRHAEEAYRRNPDDITAQLTLAKLLHMTGINGAEPDAIRAEDMLAKLAGQRPDDPTILAYLGSARLLEAARTWRLGRKGELCKDGLQLLDRAVTLATDDTEVRFLRGASTYHLPFFFDRAEQAAEDFRWVGERARASVAAGTLERTFAAAALFYDGVCRAKASDKDGARASWQAAVEIGPSTNPGRASAKQLASLEKSSR